jgi:hypothetical protein
VTDSPVFANIDFRLPQFAARIILRIVEDQGVVIAGCFGNPAHGDGNVERIISPRRRESKAVNADTDPAHAGLLQRDFAHEFGAHDLANIKAFHLYRLLLIGCAHYFSGDRVELFARVILRGHVLRFHH